ncbi:GNAT family N-acetyltransferase [Clostridium botulinum]|uniref:GNAT family N-acetyltransferase n=1 Tax=Clostridium botulinum TaxID=1491 RepID=UPI0007733787|nr:GNAT family N-acetyltransferase [Clostridium botulinum]NFH81630.1 GNAT family N-acetyltransferase [Clostridium botulinum]NFH83564.1 GNAT family N-acetyltransferase [Clostridium botulinum]NFI12762.1 GNAT family N-acetyltransferase [Clostridium botulinum]NFI15503.1 GNAT family N-acetyltransferase [Clostridium botulinum]NFO85700.1 GNAT family N-acetyltransferase [Clostridium botulinum]
MKFGAIKVELKDETECILRSPDEQDAEKMIEYLKMTSKETYFMVRYPEEIKITVNEEREHLKNNLISDKDIMIAAFVNDELAGNVSISCVRNHIKLKHRAVFGISIKEKYWNNGVGSILIKTIIEQAKKMGYEQIELGVFADNKKAQILYKKYGFEIWGTTKNAYKLKDGTYRDEIIMGKIIK